MADKEQAQEVVGDEGDEKTEDLTNPDVLTKYKKASEIANEAIKHVMSLCKVDTKVVDLCDAGDNYVEEACAKIYRSKKKVTKGVAFPSCVSVNHYVGHFSPLSGDETVLKKGDVVKIDLGVHVDGYIAVAAHTCVVLDEGEKVTGRTADVLMAAYTAAEAVVRTLKPGNTNTQCTEVIQKSAEAFGCTPVQGVLSHEMKRFVIDGEKVIIGKGDLEQKVEEIEFEPNEVYAIDIVMSTGDGKPKDDGGRTTVYKRATEESYQLKMKASRYVFSEINKNFPTFPFTIRKLDEKKVRFGIVECHKHGLVHAYPVLVEKEGELVAHLKFTALLQSNGTVKCSGLVLDLSNIECDKEVTDEDLKALLATSFGKKKKKNNKKKKKKKAGDKKVAE